MKCSLGGRNRMAQPNKSIRNSKDFDFSIIEAHKPSPLTLHLVLFLFYPLNFVFIQL